MNRTAVMHRIASLCLLLWMAPALAGERTYLEISPDGRDDLEALFTTLEGYLDQGIPAIEPVIVVLHGTEATAFTRLGYARNRELVDRAAMLDAYRLIDVRMCQTWMTNNGIEAGDIPAFIETVPFAPEEIRRLEAEGYTPYGGLDI